MIELIFLTLASLILIFLLGYGLTLLIVPKSLKEHSLLLAPWTFLLFILFFTIFLSHLGMTSSYSAPILTLLLIGISFYIYRKNPKNFFTLPMRDIPIVLFIIISITLNLSPIITRYQFPTTISMGNNDIISYATAADYLVNHSILEGIKSNLTLSVDIILNVGYRWGPSVITSYFLSVFHVYAYQYVYVLLAILYALMIPLAIILLRMLYRYSLMAEVILMTLITFNTNLLYMLYHNFFGMVLFWGISLCIIILLFNYFTKKEVYKIINRYDILLAILISTLIFSYYEGIIFVLLPVILYTIFSAIYEKQLLYFHRLIKVGLLSMVFSSMSLFNAIVYNFNQAFGGEPNAVIGWQLFRSKIPFANPFEIIGYWSIHNFEPLPIWLATILSAIIIGIIIYGLINSKHRLLLGSYFAIFIIFYFWKGAIQKHFFDYNRVVTYTLPLVLIVFTIGISKIARTKKGVALFVLASLLLVVFSGLKLNKRLLREHVAVDRNYISLEDIPSFTDEPIYVEEHVDSMQPLWRNIWVGYFVYPLIKDQTIPTEFTDDPYVLRVPDNKLLLIQKPTPWYIPTNVVWREIIWENEYYILGRVCNIDECLLDSPEDLSLISFTREEFQDSLLIKGWSTKEDGHRWISSKEATMRFVAKEKSISSLHIEVLTLQEPQEMTVYINEELINTVSLSTEWEEYVFNIGHYQNEVIHIRLEFSNQYNPAALGLSADTRDLSADIRSISLE